MSKRLPRFLVAARWLGQAAVGVTIAVLLALVSLLVWVRQGAPADELAHLALDSDELIMVSGNGWSAFQPRDIEPNIGVIFYPGGKAEPAAYAPILRDLAARGYLVVLTPMPLNLAFFGIGRASEVMARFPEIRRWFIAGHSLGGVAAAEFAQRHPGEIAGLILWASYPGATGDLARSGLPVLSIYGDADTLAAPAKIDAARQLLPPTARYVVIAGGDHWGFGDFAAELGTASIARDEQHAQVLDATAAFIEEAAGALPGTEAQ